jgi:hypothetical protein
MNRTLTDYTPETEGFETEAFAYGEAELPGHSEAVFSEADEMELAAQMLEIQSEQELDRFLGDLLKRAGQAVGTFVRSPTGQALGGILKDAAKQALPVAGRALGGYLGGERGAQLGTQAAAAAGRIFGLELEGLSPEDKEFEVAKSFVRFASDAIRNAAAAPPSAPPHVAAQSAVIKAAQRHAPGLLRGATAARRVPWSVRNQGVADMHDIDRTQVEYTQETGSGFEAEQFQYGESEWAGEGGVLTEADEVQLASELLAVSNEAELDQFLGSLIRKAGSAIGSVVRSPIGQAVGGVLKSAAKKALPLAGGAIGGYFGGPLGAKIGSGLASAAGSALGLEAESMSAEDREFEGARQFVRFAANTVKNAASAPGTANPAAIAQSAATSAARQFLPGLVGQAASGAGAGAAGRGQTGRWLRRGTKIVLYGV